MSDDVEKDYLDEAFRNAKPKVDALKGAIESLGMDTENGLGGTAYNWGGILIVATEMAKIPEKFGFDVFLDSLKKK